MSSAKLIIQRGISIRKLFFIGIDCLYSFQVKRGMVVNTPNFQALPGLIGTTGPVPATPGCFLAGFVDITGIKDYGILTASMGWRKFLATD